MVFTIRAVLSAMLTLALGFVILATRDAAASLASPFPSCVPRTQIPNTHSLDENEIIIRGMAPRNQEDIDSLKNLGIERVLIFKNQTRNEVDKEVAQLVSSGWTKQQVSLIPFPWKEHKSFKDACTQTIEALKILQDHHRRNLPLYFHCTVGEDRTGYLAGLLRWWWEDAPLEEIFERELCMNGYGAGNPRKPFRQVVQKIRDSLTPLFVKMAYVLADAQTLDAKKLCAKDPQGDSEYQTKWQSLVSQFECQESPRYQYRDDAKKACSL
ncbi:MAG: tyrosine-protein phosphatase [Bdellovibrionaceae bacterium]|nr:tyrosine-protein phosphatase [Bdellovibrionales bacterium]MCB9084138.1 tyrosine-protein phosphatase [Pseudobdellovibrionaceae bacterium]